jgi:hypothetical protein
VTKHETNELGRSEAVLSGVRHERMTAEVLGFVALAWLLLR